jgi:antitoxin MazE
MPIRARIIKIGNSQGIRIPKLVLEQAGLRGEVEIDVRHGHIILSAASEPRAGWAAAFETMARAGDETREAAIGLTEDWSLLVVVHVVRQANTLRIISARPATPPERRGYEDE